MNSNLEEIIMNSFHKNVSGAFGILVVHPQACVWVQHHHVLPVRRPPADQWDLVNLINALISGMESSRTVFEFQSWNQSWFFTYLNFI